jgi:hypothetical protein
MTKHPGFVAHEAAEGEKANPVRLALKTDGDGSVTVHAVNVNGTHISGSHIAKFSSDGSLYLHSGIMHGLVALDTKSRIKLSSY